MAMDVENLEEVLDLDIIVFKIQIPVKILVSCTILVYIKI